MSTMSKILFAASAIEILTAAVVLTLVVLDEAPRLILWIAIVIISNTLGGLLTSLARDRNDNRLAQATTIVLKAIAQARDEATESLEARIESARRQIIEAALKDLSGQFTRLGDQVTEQMQYVLKVFGHYAHDEAAIEEHIEAVSAMNVQRSDHNLLHLRRR